MNPGGSGSSHAMQLVVPGMLNKATRVFHNPKTAAASLYLKLEAFQKALANYQVKDVSSYTHDLRWIKSPSKIRLMRESASIGCQDSFRSHDRNKETSKLMKQLTKIFPNKVTIQPPQVVLGEVAM